MISIAIITLGICTVICTFIVCVTKYNIDIERKTWKRRFFVLCDDVLRFTEEFNNTYTNTKIELTEKGLKVVDVEPKEE